MLKCSIISLLALVACLALPLALLAQITLTVAETYPEDAPTTQGLFEFSKLVNARSNGEITVVVKFGGALGQNEKEIVAQVQSGAVDLARISLASMTAFAPALDVFGLPYIWKSQDTMRTVLNGEIGARLLRELENSQFYGLCYYEAGARSFYNSRHVIASVQDLQGLRIRVQPDQFMTDFVTALGAEAVLMTSGEVYDAIRKGVIDGAEGDWRTYESSGHYEVARFYTLDGHIRIPEILIASKAALDQKLLPEQIALVMRAARDSRDVVSAHWNARAEASKNIVLNSGATVTELLPEAFDGFFQAVQPLYQTYGAQYQAIIAEIRAAQQ